MLLRITQRFDGITNKILEDVSNPVTDAVLRSDRIIEIKLP